MPKSHEKYQPSPEEIKKAENKAAKKDLYTDPPRKGVGQKWGEPIPSEEEIDRMLGQK